VSLDAAPAPRAPFLKKHLRVFAERGIPEALAHAYHLRSFSEQQMREFLERRDLHGTALYIPPCGADSYTPRLRLDDPASNGGARYLTKKGAEVVPFVLRGVQPGSDPVYVVEAPLKAIAMEAHGFPSTVGLGGVSAGAFKKGSDDLRPEIARLVQPERLFYIVFDSNRSSKAQVALAEAKLARALRRAGAAISLVALPLLADGKDQGPDDFLVASGATALRALIAQAAPSDVVPWAATASTPAAAADLLRSLPFQAALSVADKPTLDLVIAAFKRHKITAGSVRSAIDEFRTTLSAASQRNAVSAPSYAVDDKGRICLIRHDGEGGDDLLVPLCNFSAKIVDEIVFDDGAEQERVFVVEAMLEGGGALPHARVKSREFSDLRWVYSEWGARATPIAGRLAQEQLREAIQSISTPTARTVYRHTGWRAVAGGRQVFLFHGGAVGGDSMSVELDGPLARYVFPPRPESSAEAIQTALDLLEVAPLAVTVPLLAAAFLAPLSPILRPDFVVWLVGITGSLKSELAALAQSFFGAGFHRTALPGSWTSTENALEGQMFQSKDVLFVIDDYAPQASQRAHLQMQERAVRVIRSVGNGASRSRLRHDLSQRPDRPPRGLVMVTGEEMPVGASILARVVRVDVDRSEIRLDRLTGLQERRPLLSVAMRAHVEALAPRLESLASSLPEQHRSLRSAFAVVSAHMRQPEALAALEIGFEQFTQLAVEHLVLTLDEAETLKKKAHGALLEIGMRNAEKQLETDPGAVFVATIRALLTQGRVKLAPKGADLELHADLGCDPVGWEDQTYVYLVPELAHRAVVRFCSSAGGHFGSSVEQLKRILLDRGYLVRPDGPGVKRLEVSVRVGARTERAIRLRREVIIEPHHQTEDEVAEEQALADAYNRVVQ
jgi:hypothetical protein